MKRKIWSLLTANFILIFLSASQLISQSAYTTGIWVKTGGPIGGLGYDVRHSFTNLDKWYVTDAWGGIFLSEDRGLHWHEINDGITTRKGVDGIPVFCVAVDPHNSDLVWIGTELTGKIYKSINRGETWTEKSLGISDTLMPLSFRGITIDPVDSGILFAMAEIGSAAWHSGGEPVIGIELDLTMGIVYKSTDEGEHWREVWRGNNLARYCLINPQNTQEMYVSTGIFDRESANTDVGAGFAGGVGILKSEDGGESWRVLNESNGLMDLYVGSLFMHPVNPDTLLATASQNNWSAYGEEFTGGIYITTNGGDQWQKLSDKEELFTVAEYCICDPNIAYVVSNDAVYRSEDAGFTWKRFNRPNGTWGPPGVIAGVPIDILCDPEDPMRIMVNNYLGGNYLSLDGGETWQIASDGYTGSLIRAMTVSKIDPALVYSGSRSGVFYSKNGGKNWFGMANPPDGLPAKFNEISTIVSNPFNDLSLRAVALDYPGVLYSYNGGKSWEATEKLIGYEKIEFSPADSSILYAYAGNGTFITLPENIPPENEMDALFGLYRSSDGGIHWNQIESAQVKGKCIATFELDPMDPDILYVSMCNGAMLRSYDGGNTWEVIGDGLPIIPALTLEASEVNPLILYAGLGYKIPMMGLGLYKSVDGGNTWDRLTAGLEPEGLFLDIAIDPENDSVIYIADNYSGVFVTFNGGATWQELNEGIDHRAANVLELSADGSVLYLGTEGGGVYRLGEVPVNPTHISINKYGSNDISVSPGFPNPFKETTTLNFTVLNRADIQISIYNSMGSVIKSLVNQTYNPGQYSVQWNGINNSGSYVHDGIYLMNIRAGNQSQSVKIYYIK